MTALRAPLRACHVASLTGGRRRPAHSSFCPLPLCDAEPDPTTTAPRPLTRPKARNNTPARCCRRACDRWHSVGTGLHGRICCAFGHPIEPPQAKDQSKILHAGPNPRPSLVAPPSHSTTQYPGLAHDAQTWNCQPLAPPCPSPSPSPSLSTSPTYPMPPCLGHHPIPGTSDPETQALHPCSRNTQN